MIVQCTECHLEFDDFDHWTFCPHDRFFRTPEVRRLQKRGSLRRDSGPEGDPHPPAPPGFVGVKQQSFDQCFHACIASVLSIPYEDGPTFHQSADWIADINRQLGPSHGFHLRIGDKYPVFDGYWIALVPSLNFKGKVNHGVVMHGSQMIWDASARKTYTTVSMDIVITALFLIPLDPARLLNPAATVDVRVIEDSYLGPR
ncbi:MAG: hypothetical protein ACRDKI_06915 [Solirubrobacterales bacterium]